MMKSLSRSTNYNNIERKYSAEYFEDLFLKKNNGIYDTENIIEIGLWFMDFSELFPLLTCRTKGELKQYFFATSLKFGNIK